MPDERPVRPVVAAWFALGLGCMLLAWSEVSHAASLNLAQTISLGAVAGRIDHFAADIAGHRLFVCALGNDSVEVVDLQKGERVHSITGLGAPQGVAFAPAGGRLFVASDKGGLVNVYDGTSFAPLSRIDLKDDADNVRYDAASKRIYVGYGNGGIVFLESETGQVAVSVKLPAHPEAFVLEKDGPRIFVNIPTARQVAVVDRAQARVIATWRTGDATANFPIALDEANHRLFVGCRSPATLVIINMDSGTVVTTMSISGDVDDVFYDEKRHRLYAICGAGSIDIIDQIDKDNYKMNEKVATAPGARTGFFVPELSSLFVAVPRRGSQGAEVRRFTVN